MDLMIAVKALRGAVTQPSVFYGEVEDPGWCCFEHSTIFSRVLTNLGVESKCCFGKVLCSGPQLNPEFILEHRFLFSKEYGILDSSISFGGIQGIPFNYKDYYPNLVIGEFWGSELEYAHSEMVHKHNDSIVLTYNMVKAQPEDIFDGNWNFESEFQRSLFNDFPGLEGNYPWDRAGILLAQMVVRGESVPISRDQFWIDVLNIDESLLDRLPRAVQE